MQSLKLHIVGFPYRKNIEGHVSEFLSDAPGHGMTLRPQRNNEVDVHAIRAYDWEGSLCAAHTHLLPQIQTLHHQGDSEQVGASK